MTQSRRRKQLNNTKKLYWSSTKPNYATMKYYKVKQKKYRQAEKMTLI